MENIDKTIEDFIKDISPETGGIDKMAQLKIKYFIKDIYLTGKQDGLAECRTVFNNTVKKATSLSEQKTEITELLKSE